jgi:hypothetical protein
VYFTQKDTNSRKPGEELAPTGHHVSRLSNKYVIAIGAGAYTVSKDFKFNGRLSFKK